MLFSIGIFIVNTQFTFDNCLSISTAIVNLLSYISGHFDISEIPFIGEIKLGLGFAKKVTTIETGLAAPLLFQAWAIACESQKCRDPDKPIEIGMFVIIFTNF